MNYRPQELETWRHPIFKGCTRPAMWLHVPLVPMLCLSGAALLLAMWSGYLLNGYVSLVVLLSYIGVVVVLRAMTKKDDQRLRQMILRLRMRVRHTNKVMWGAVSFSPLRYKRRP